MPADPRLSGQFEAPLVARACAGDAAAFGELARRHAPVVRGMLRRMGADVASAEDLAQEAFLTGFQKLASLQDRAAFLPWIKTIAARLYVRRWRRDSRLRFFDEPPEGEPEPLPDTAARMDLEAALAQLPEAQRLCIGLCFGADLTHEEAAQVLNAPLGTVKSHVKRGLENLRRRMGPPADAERQAHV